MSLDSRFKKELSARVENEKRLARQYETAETELTRFAEDLEHNDLRTSAADTRSRAAEHLTAAQQHLIELERLISLLRDPARISKILNIARRELSRLQK